MKKILAFALIAALALMMCACGVETMPTFDDIRGTVSGNVYENEYLSLKFTNPTGWEFASEEEIAALAGTTEDVLNEGGINTDDIVQNYDMMSFDENTGNNINLMLQIVGNTGKIDFDELLDESEEQIREFGSVVGFTYTFSGHDTVKLSGTEFHKLTATSEYAGITFTQVCYIAVVRGVCINITITIMDGTPVSEIEAMFS